MSLFKPTGENSNAAAFLEAASVIKQTLTNQAKDISIHISCELRNELTATPTPPLTPTSVATVK